VDVPKAGTAAVFVVVACAAFAGCGSDPQPLLTSAYDAKDPQTWTFEQVVDQAVTDAEAAHATQSQLDELKAAKASGAITPAQVRSANQAYIECVQALGATTTPMEDRTSMGMWWPSFSVTAPAGKDEATWGPLDQDCNQKNLSYVMYVYGNQPAAREALGAALAEHEAELKQCLIDMGGAAEINDFTVNEMWKALKDQSFGGQDYGYSQEKDCIIDAGINW